MVFAVGNDLCRPAVVGTAVSFVNMLVMIGGAISQPVIGIILDSVSVINAKGSMLHSVQDFTLALLILPAGMLLATACAFALKESYQTEH